MSQNFIPFDSWIIFHCILGFVLPLICWWILRLFSLLGYCENAAWTLVTGICLSPCFQLFGVYSPSSRIAGSYAYVDIQFSHCHLLKRLSFPHVYCWHLCWRSLDHIWMSLTLGSLFCSVGLYVCFYASITLFNYCNFVNIFWIRKCDASSFVLFFLRFLWLSWIFGGFIWILGLFFLFL